MAASCKTVLQNVAASMLNIKYNGANTQINSRIISIHTCDFHVMDKKLKR